MIYGSMRKKGGGGGGSKNPPISPRPRNRNRRPSQDFKHEIMSKSISEKSMVNKQPRVFENEINLVEDEDEESFEVDGGTPGEAVERIQEEIKSNLEEIENKNRKKKSRNHELKKLNINGGYR
jgi:hypothetical protein